MVTLAIGNSYSNISGLTAKQEQELKTLLSYEVGSQAAFFAGGHRPRRKSLLGRRGEFPTGLLSKVIANLYHVDVKIVDSRIIPTPTKLSFDLKGPPAYAAQIKALNAAVKHGRGCISMPTGTGKSKVIALIAEALRVKTLVVVPSLEIKKQLIESLDQTFDGNAGHITVENIDSKNLLKSNSYDCLIIDEAHHVAAKTYQKLNKTAWSTIYHRFFLTATPFRNNNEETLLFESIAGDLIYQLSYKEAISQGYIVPVDAYYLECPKIKNDYYSWAEVYNNLVVKNEARNEMLAYLMLQLNLASRNTLCLVKEVAHGRTLAELSGFPFANGQDEASRQHIKAFNKGEIKVLIGTTGLLGEGIDTKPAEWVIIAALGKAKSAFMQQVGRAVRVYGDKDSAKIVLIKDKSHKFCSRHFNAQCVILEQEYGITTTRLEF